MFDTPSPIMPTKGFAEQRNERKMAELTVEGTEKAVGSSAAPVSFGFTRTTGRRRLLPSAGQDGGEAKVEPDFLHAVEGRELQR